MQPPSPGGQPLELARFFRAEAERVRGLAGRAQMPEIRDTLLDMVRDYEELASRADADR